MQNRPKVGLGIIVKKDDKVLLGFRVGELGHGTWRLPGGHLEFGESWAECAARETFEEAGITIKNIRFGTATNDITENGTKHYITIFMVADFDAGEPTVKEPDKITNWTWFEWNQLPSPLFQSCTNLLATGFDPFAK